MGAVDFLVGHNVPNYIFFSPVLSFSRSLTPCALSSLVVCKENSINLFAKLECLLHESVWRCLPPRSPRIVNYSFSSRTKQNLTTLSRSLWPRFQPLSGLAFNLSLASLSTSSPTLAFQATSAFFYRMPCSALAKKSLRIHDPALTPGLGSEKGYTFIFQATKGKET